MRKRAAVPQVMRTRHDLVGREVQLCEPGEVFEILPGDMVLSSLAGDSWCALGCWGELGFESLVFKAHRLCVSLNSRIESNKEEEGVQSHRSRGHAAISFAVRSSSMSPKRPLKSYRGASLIRTRPPLGPYSRTMIRALWWS